MSSSDLWRLIRELSTDENRCEWVQHLLEEMPLYVFDNEASRDFRQVARWLLLRRDIDIGRWAELLRRDPTNAKLLGMRTPAAAHLLHVVAEAAWKRYWHHLVSGNHSTADQAFRVELEGFEIPRHPRDPRGDVMFGEKGGKVRSFGRYRSEDRWDRCTVYVCACGFETRTESRTFTFILEPGNVRRGRPADARADTLARLVAFSWHFLTGEPPPRGDPYDVTRGVAQSQFYKLGEAAFRVHGLPWRLNRLRAAARRRASWTGAKKP